MNVPSSSSGEFGLRERLRSAESRLRAADALAVAARTCLAAPGWEALHELRAALDRYRDQPLLGAPGRLLTDHRLAGAKAAVAARVDDRPTPVPASRELLLPAFGPGNLP